jgi:hypothetical protein
MSLRVKEASKFVGYAFSVFLVHSAEFREIGNKSKASWAHVLRGDPGAGLGSMLLVLVVIMASHYADATAAFAMVLIFSI